VVEIYQKQKLADGSYLIKVKAPEVAKKTSPGQYISLQRDSESPRLPLFITETKNGIISFMANEDSPSGALIKLKKGDKFQSFCGPLGKPFTINEFGNVIILADEDRIGPAFFFGKKFKQAGNRVYFIGRYKNKKARFWEKKLSQSFDKWFLLNKKEEMRDSMLKELNNLLRKKHIKLTIALCDLELMDRISHLTQLRSSFYCSLLPLVGDAPGLCISSRVNLNGETKLPCIDGPLFNGHRINWAQFRVRYLKSQEQLVDLDANRNY